MFWTIFIQSAVLIFAIVFVGSILSLLFGKKS